MRIFIVRHAESEGNAKRKKYRQAFAALNLTDKGKPQAQESGNQFAEWLQARGLGGAPLKVYCSIFKRAQQTRDLFLQGKDALGNGLNVIQEHLSAELGEVQYGSFDGYVSVMTKKTFKKDAVVPHGESSRPMNATDKAFLQSVLAKDMYNAKPHNGESGEEVCARARRFIEEEHITESKEDVVLFTHSYAAMALAAVLTNKEPSSCKDSYNTMPHLKNGQVLMLEGDAEHGFTQTLLAIDPNKTEEKTLTASTRPSTEMNRQHLTDFNGHAKKAAESHYFQKLLTAFHPASPRMWP